MYAQGPLFLRKSEVWRPGAVGAGTGGDKDQPRSINICSHLSLHGYTCLNLNYLLASPERGDYSRAAWPQNYHDCQVIRPVGAEGLNRRGPGGVLPAVSSGPGFRLADHWNRPSRR